VLSLNTEVYTLTLLHSVKHPPHISKHLHTHTPTGTSWRHTFTGNHRQMEASKHRYTTATSWRHTFTGNHRQTEASKHRYTHRYLLETYIHRQSQTDGST